MKKVLFVISIMMLSIMPVMAQDASGGQNTEVTDSGLQDTEVDIEVTEIIAVDDAGDSEIVTEVAVVEDETVPDDAFKVYTEKWADDDHYTPSGWMGDYGDISIDEDWKKDPHSGNTCIKISYTGQGSQSAGWIGIYWQNPPNNWGDQMGGYDLTDYKKLAFWARGENGGEIITEFKMGGIAAGLYPDSDSTAIGNVVLTKDWKRYEIDLTGLDMSFISGGFCLTASSVDNPEGLKIYLDDIAFEK